MPFVVANYVYASSQGQRTHSARTNNFEMSPGQDYAREQDSKFREQVKEGVMVMNEMVVLKRMLEEMKARPRITSIARKEVRLVTEKG